MNTGMNTTPTLTVEQLLSVTPLEEETRKRALENLPRMNDTERFELEQICWETLMDQCKIRSRTRFEEAILKVSKGELSEKIDRKAIEDQVLNELLAKIEGVLSETQILKVKEMLQANINRNASQTQNK